eukprot:scaffold59769_cov72-Phaeocystis_antarctica.AAC.2
MRTRTRTRARTADTTGTTDTTAAGAFPCAALVARPGSMSSICLCDTVTRRPTDARITGRGLR